MSAIDAVKKYPVRPAGTVRGKTGYGASGRDAMLRQMANCYDKVGGQMVLPHVFRFVP